MTAQITEPISVRTSGSAQPLPLESDLSCRTPVIFLLTCSVLWLIFSLLASVLASVKMHAPGMLAGHAALTYGRVAAVSSTAFFYGFASQAGIAIALWLFARMGRTFLVIPGGALIAGIFWNVILTFAVVGILGGGMNAFPVFEMPAWAGGGLLAAFVILGLSGILTYVARSERQSYPSNWFLFGAFFILPWILSTAWLLLGRYPIRGVLQPIISTWYANNFIALWLTPLALAVIYYFVSKLSQQPLYSYSLAAFSFWFYLAFAHLSGFQNMVAVPNWLPSLSSIINLLLLLSVAAMLINWYKTWKPTHIKKQKDPASKYILFSMFSFLAGAFLLAFVSCPVFNALLGQTIFLPGLAALASYGFIGMAFFGAIVHILPRLTEVDWPNPKLVSAHFALTAAGILLSVVGLLLGGFLHGQALNNPSVASVEISRKIVPFIGISTLGALITLLGQLALFWNMALMFKSCCQACCSGLRREVVR
jgi:cytochrome c oxidase cbb3-type subunit 1